MTLDTPPPRRVVDSPRRVQAPSADDTLSEWTWDVLGDPGGARWHIITLVLVLGCALIGLGLHLVR